MSRKFAGAAVLALVLTACAGGGPTFKQSFATSKAQFHKLGADIVHEITAAGATSDVRLASEFNGLAARARRQAAQLSRLKPPAKYKQRVSDLITGFHALGGDLAGISAAAEQHDAALARSTTTTMLKDAAGIKAADTGLSKSLGLPAG
jgi:hypothetical protein